MMVLKKWDELPEALKNNEVRVYYDILSKKKGSLILKRLFDIAGSTLLLILLSPLFLILAIVIKADSKGPIFFRQTRVTQYGREFKIYKFRTMVNNAEKLGSQVTTRNDSRVTKVGHFLRKYRLDEISQLINVLIGDMTFVGTRPEVPKYVERYSPVMMATLLLSAGITSEGCIFYKDESRLINGAEDVNKVYVEEVLPRKMYYNLKTIETYNFLGDIHTIFRTLFAVFGKKYKPDIDGESKFLENYLVSVGDQL